MVSFSKLVSFDFKRATSFYIVRIWGSFLHYKIKSAVKTKSSFWVTRGIISNISCINYK